MASDPSSTAAVDRPAAIDSGLHCPRCDYNLTGLSRSRCPECGTTFDWDEVRRAAEHRPRIAFERARRWRKIPAFAVTWATVLFAPWIFAKQIVQHVSWRHGFAFGAICFAGTALAYFSDLDGAFHATWLTTALAYVALQTMWLSVLDPAMWQRPAETLRFWLLAGCYTSAVMPTEIVYGPPPLLLEDLWDFITTRQVHSWLDDIFRFGADSAVWWAQLFLWILALCCVYARRVAQRPSTSLVVIWTIVVGASLLVLYAAALQWIGAPLSDVFD